MSVELAKYNEDLARRFEREAKRLRDFVGPEVVIEHVGSSAVGIGGKNIVDILVGVKSEEDMKRMRDILAVAGYREGHDTHPDRIFMAFRVDDDGTDRETKDGDFHIHICVKGSETYLDFLRLRDYLLKNRNVALEYERKKKDFVREAGGDRKKYRAIKSMYVSELLEKARLG